MARPTKYKGASSLIVRKLIEAFKHDFNVQEACSYAGISKDTYYRWNKEYEEFSYEITKAKQFIITEAKKVVAQAIRGGCIKSSVWFLERRDERYSRRRRATVKQHEELTSEEERQVDEALREAGFM